MFNGKTSQAGSCTPTRAVGCSLRGSAQILQLKVKRCVQREDESGRLVHAHPCCGLQPERLSSDPPAQGETLCSTGRRIRPREPSRWSRQRSAQPQARARPPVLWAMFLLAGVENQMVCNFIPSRFKRHGTTCKCQLVSCVVDTAVGGGWEGGVVCLA